MIINVIVLDRGKKMRISKNIPIATVLVDTKKNKIIIKSPDTKIVIKGIEFEKIEEKFSDILINDNKVCMKQSRKKSNPGLTTAMVNLYNLLFNEDEEIIEKVVKNATNYINRHKKEKNDGSIT